MGGESVKAERKVKSQRGGRRYVRQTQRMTDTAGSMTRNEEEQQAEVVAHINEEARTGKKLFISDVLIFCSKRSFLFRKRICVRVWVSMSAGTQADEEKRGGIMRGETRSCRERGTSGGRGKREGRGR
jgi:hypothetical protein